MEEEKKDVKKQETKPEEKVEKNETKPVEKKEEKKEEKKVADKKAITEEKKAEKVEGEKKKSKNGVIIVVLIIAALIIAVGAYMLFMQSSPEKIVESMLNDLKTGNYDQEMFSELAGQESFDEEAQKLLFEKLDWKIIKVTEEGNKATVEVEITNKDFKTVIGNYMQRVLKAAFAGENPNEEQVTNYLIEELKNEEIQTVTSNQAIILEKKDGKWEVTEENDFAVILLPGFMEALNSFN